MVNPSPSNFALSSKRWRAGLGGMLMMVAVSMPIFGIPPDVAEQLREFFAAIVISFIAGQTVTDVVTKGKSSGSIPDDPPAAAAPKPPPTAGRALLLVPLILAAGVTVASFSCSHVPFFGNVAAAEEKAAAAQLELDQARAEKALLEVQLTAAAAERAAALEDLARRAAEAEARVAAAEATAGESVEKAAEVAAALAAAEATRAELAKLLAAAPAPPALTAIEERLAVAERAAAETRAAADAAREAAAAASGTTAGLLGGTGLGQILGPLGLLAAAGAAEWGRARALRAAAGRVT